MKSEASSRTWLRVALGLFGVFLSAQATWILLAERYPFVRIGLPADAKAAVTAFVERGRVRQAASFAVVRGDLWAESAFTCAGRLWTDQAMDLNSGDKSGREPLNALTQALRYSPHRGDVWLMFAALADQYKWPGYQPAALLKMSYYTAPNELAWFPLRLSVSLRLKGVMEDAELQEMVGRDISLILMRAPALKPVLAAAYGAASPPGRALVQRVIAATDPGYLNTIRAAYP
jgi:hypothetical protein